MRSWTTFRQTQSPNSWDNLQNKPAILSDNQISWNEIQNKPVIENYTLNLKVKDHNGYQFLQGGNFGKGYRIGNIFFFSFEIYFSPKPINAPGDIQVTGLPFNFPDSSNIYHFIPGYWHGTNTLICDPFLGGIANTNKISLFYCTNTTFGYFEALRGNQLLASKTVYVYGSGSILL